MFFWFLSCLNYKWSDHCHRFPLQVCLLWPTNVQLHKHTFSLIALAILKLTSIRGVIKKFVDWCDEINNYKAMLTNFEGHIKQQKFYQLWKFQLYTLLNNHFIIENNLYGMVTRRSLRDVAQRHCFSMLLSIILWYTFARYRIVKYQLKQSFFKNIKFDELLSEIGNVLQKMWV